MPKNITTSRLIRLVDEAREYSSYRKALPHLLEETGNRCAYSLQHIDHFGERTMEVDHFDPTLKGTRRDRHGDLVCASHHCNNCKRASWPKPEQLAKRIRFLNPYLEHDYGVHLFEDLETGKLVPVGPEGVYHIRYLGLNAAFLISARLMRTEALRKKKEAKECADRLKEVGCSEQNLVDSLISLTNETTDPFLKIMIPVIPASPNKKPPSGCNAIS